MTDTLCAACGHAHRRHDPEDGNCEAHADVGLGRCPCDVFVAPEDARSELLSLRRELLDYQRHYDFCVKERRLARDGRREMHAEVERLRGEAERERAAVVAYLRRIFPEWPSGTNGYADEVERGEHRREGGGMTEEQIALARRAGASVACKGWKWMSGMATVEGHRVVLVDDDVLWMVYDGEGKCKPACVEDFVPDLTDPATLGCLLALVREAWGDNCACVLPVDYGPGGVMWVCQLTAGGRSLINRHWATEAEALVAALEGAP